MAWLEQRGNQFHIGIRLGTRKLKRSLQTADPIEAQAAADRIERRLKLVEQGDLVIPAEADPLTFLLSDGKLNQPVEINLGTSLGDACQRYLASLPEGSLEANTLGTLKIHLAHIRRVLGDQFRIDVMTFADLQRYVNSRAREKGKRGKNLSTVTIKKELTSFSGLWTWASRSELVKSIFPNKGLRYPNVDEKPPFQSEIEIEELWDGLYLTASEIEEVLDFVKANARHPFIYPMLLLAAHTGARRSEILRSQISDFDLVANVVRLRELKRAQGKRTMRAVPLSGRLQRVMQDWLHGRKSRHAFTGNGEPLTVDEASHHLNQTLKDTNWEKIRGWHVFRHSFVSNCASQGIDQRMIDAWTGHQTDEMRKRYRHLFPTVQRAALLSVFGG